MAAAITSCFSTLRRISADSTKLSCSEKMRAEARSVQLLKKIRFASHAPSNREEREKISHFSSIFNKISNGKCLDGEIVSALGMFGLFIKTVFTPTKKKRVEKVFPFNALTRSKLSMNIRKLNAMLLA
jgi:hypothetical protein